MAPECWDAFCKDLGSVPVWRSLPLRKASKKLAQWNVLRIPALLALRRKGKRIRSSRPDSAIAKKKGKAK